jgi:hypothetical protein
MAQLGAGWTWTHDFEAKRQQRLAKLFGFIERLVQVAAIRGEIRTDIDLAVFGDILLGL